MTRAGRKQSGGYGTKPVVSESEAAGVEGFLFLGTSSCLKWEMVTTLLSDYRRHSASWINRTQKGGKESDPACSTPVQPACTAWPCSGSWESIVSTLPETLEESSQTFPQPSQAVTSIALSSTPATPHLKKHSDTGPVPEGQLITERELAR